MPSFPATRSLGRSAAVAAVAAAALGARRLQQQQLSSSRASRGLGVRVRGAASSSASAAPKAMNIAYLSFAVDNTYDAPMLAAAQAVASTDGATLKVFDANNNPQTQFNQLQTVISSGQYNGIITQPIVSTGLVSLVQQAIAKGIKVVNMDQILGPSLSTDAPQVTGLSANVTFVPTTIGTQLGQQVVAACASKNLNPCKVGYLYDIKASSLDTAIYSGFTAAIKGSPVQVVTNGQSFFTPTIGETATQTMLQAQPGLNVITGSDQGMEGATVALLDRAQDRPGPPRRLRRERRRDRRRGFRCLVLRRRPGAGQRGAARRPGAGGGDPDRQGQRRRQPGGRRAERRHCHQGDGQPVHG